MPNLQIKMYHRYVCIEKKVYREFGTIRGFRHPLGILEQIRRDHYTTCKNFSSMPNTYQECNKGPYHVNFGRQGHDSAHNRG